MKTGKLQWRLARMILALALVSSGCDSTAKRHWLSFFFDGVPGQVTSTNAVATEVNSTSTEVVTAPAKPPPPPPDTSSSHPPFLQQKCADCHGSAIGMDLKTPTPGLCWNCHKDFLLLFQKQIHIR